MMLSRMQGIGHGARGLYKAQDMMLSRIQGIGHGARGLYEAQDMMLSRIQGIGQWTWCSGSIRGTGYHAE